MIKNLYTIKPEQGETIYDFATKLADKAYLEGVRVRNIVKVEGIFNDVKLSAFNDTHSKDLVEQYYKKFEIPNDQLFNCYKLKEIINQLDQLNLKDENEVLLWFCKLENVNYYSVQRQDLDYILDNLIKCGYHSDMNSGDSFDANNQSNYALYIIGQVMSALEVGNMAILSMAKHIIHEYFDLFKECPISLFQNDK